jgi:hypothetical protein
VINQLDQREIQALTSGEMEILMSIADYCPFRYGQAVYSARVLIKSQYGYETMFWDDEDRCVRGVDFRKANPLQLVVNETANNDFVIYPNPVSTELNFKIQQTSNCSCSTNTNIEIVDIFGKSVLKKEYNGFLQSGKINISILANGAYIIKYSCGNSEIYRLSFVVNK